MGNSPRRGSSLDRGRASRPPPSSTGGRHATGPRLARVATRVATRADPGLATRAADPGLATRADPGLATRADPGADPGADGGHPLGRGRGRGRRGSRGRRSDRGGFDRAFARLPPTRSHGSMPPLLAPSSPFHPPRARLAAVVRGSVPGGNGSARRPPASVSSPLVVSAAEGDRFHPRASHRGPGIYIRIVRGI